MTRLDPSIRSIDEQEITTSLQDVNYSILLCDRLMPMEESSRPIEPSPKSIFTTYTPYALCQLASRARHPQASSHDEIFIPRNHPVGLRSLDGALSLAYLNRLQYLLN